MECTDKYSSESIPKLLHDQYENVVKKINDTRAMIPIELNDIQARAETVFQDFISSVDISPAAAAFEQIDLDIDKRISLKKIELMCKDLFDTELEAFALGVNVLKIGEAVRFILEDAKSYIPTATRSQVEVHERAARRRLLIAKSEYNKKMTFKQMEKNVIAYNASNDEPIRQIFESHVALLHLNETDFFLSVESKTVIFENFLDELAFLETDKAIYRSNDNKTDAIKKMRKLFSEVRQFDNNEKAKLILEEHIAKLKLTDSKVLIKFSDCQDVMMSLIKTLENLLKKVD